MSPVVFTQCRDTALETSTLGKPSSVQVVLVKICSSILVEDHSHMPFSLVSQPLLLLLWPLDIHHFVGCWSEVCVWL